MKLGFQLLLTAGLLVSCTTVATKDRPTAPSMPDTKAQGIGGLSSGKPPESKVVIDTSMVDKSVLGNLKSLVSLATLAPGSQGYNAGSSESARNRAIDIVENKLSPSELSQVAKDSDFGFLRASAMFRLGEIYLQDDEVSDAKKYFNSVIDFMPESDYAMRSKEILEQLDNARRVQSHTIGAVLPLSGRNAAIGERALRGLQMGLGLHIPGSGFKLAVMDSEGNADSARRGVERLVKEDNVIGIVGSLLSKTAPSVAAKAQELKVPSIGLSQRNGLTEAGDFVFRNSLTSTMQVRALVRHSMESLGVKKFAILYPNDAYGTEFANIFWDEVLARGGQVTAVQNYSTKETDFRLVIQRLVGTYFGEARADEYKLRLNELKTNAKKGPSRNANVENILTPVVDFDAIFIPDSVRAMGQISAMLSYSDISKVKLLGTNLWNTKDVSKRAGHFVNSLIFVDSLTPQIKASNRFVNEYRSLYNEEPSLIEVQAYDAGLLLRQLIASGTSSREALADKLTKVEAFPGAIGSLSTNNDRELERPLTLLTVANGEVVPFFKK